eukprot:9478381-Pyramimonas_sp.AAC.1
MTLDHFVLVAVAGEQRGHLPKWGHPRDCDTEETHHVLLCSMVDDCCYGLDSDENGQYVEVCCTAEMSTVVLSGQQHRILDTSRVTTMRVYVTAAAKRAVAVKEDDLLAMGDAQANPEEVSRAIYTELTTWFDKKPFNMQGICKASSSMTSKYVRTWKFVKNENGEMGRTIRLRLVLRGFKDLAACRGKLFGNSAAVKPKTTREHG